MCKRNLMTVLFNNLKQNLFWNSASDLDNTVSKQQQQQQLLLVSLINESTTKVEFSRINS